MTTIDEALDTITKTVRQNEPGELAREIRLLRAEIARLSGEVAALKSRPQVIPQPYVVHPPYYPPPVLPPPRPWSYPDIRHITSTHTGTGVDHDRQRIGGGGGPDDHGPARRFDRNIAGGCRNR